MKKLFTLILGITLAYSCSTSSDENGNSDTTVVPFAPSNLTGTVGPRTKINLSWTDNSTNEIGFKIERKTGTGVYAVLETTATDVNTFIDTGLTPSTTYTYRVYSYNSVGNSQTYSNEVTITTPQFNDPGPNMTDIDGNVYQSVTNCSQTWMQQNLKVSRYRDGTPIPQVTDPAQWANLTTGAWCYYNNTTANGTIYGKLYNWYAVAGIHDAASLNNPALRKKLAPTGWHVPSSEEWSFFFNCIDYTSYGGANYENIVGGAMKATGTIQAGTGLWQSPNNGATNESGFTCLPAGFREVDGSYYGIGGYVYLWSLSENGTTLARSYSLTNSISKIYLQFSSKQSGFSVRCIRD